MTRINLFAIAILIAFVGCQTMNLDPKDTLTDWFPKSKKGAGEANLSGQPERIAAIWTSAVYTEPGKLPVRGFGGRLYFYGADGNPVRVNGRLTVYGYDDSKGGETLNPVPDRKFVFTEEQLNQLYTPGPLGPSYSIWLPWDRVGGFQKSITLIPKLTRADGTQIAGQQALNVLVGKPKRHENLTPRGQFANISPAADGEVQKLGFEQASHDSLPATQQPRSHIRTSTIDLPPSMAQRLIKAHSVGAQYAVPASANHGQASEAVPAATGATGGISIPVASPPTTATAEPAGAAFPEAASSRSGHPKRQAPSAGFGRADRDPPR